ncbi:MAG TPA: efflux RND transporter permease subunit [Terriglobia bacterium]|nr:efflux RND transporter permease subunit [Terriglobia bacterium]
MSRFFINRPIVAMVISILTVIIGVVTITQLPVSQFPQIATPEVLIRATYVGADSQTIEQSVATPIEQQMSGVDNLNYMYSLNAGTGGQMTMIVDYDVKSDPNTDLMLAQMRVTQAASQLPQDVNNYGVTVQKSVSAPLMAIGLYSPKGTYDARFLTNYAYINLNDQLTRVPGIGSVQVFGAGQYAMRLWVKPDQLSKLGITVADITSAIQAQNTVNPAGQVGGAPVPKGQEYTWAVRAQGRLTSPEEFGDIIVRESTDGGLVRVRDVARIELGSQDYSQFGRINGKPGAIVTVYQTPGSNAVEAARGVRKVMEENKKRFPQDVDYVMALDTTASVTEGINEIFTTIIIAIGLVAIVVYLFLQSWRATLIPLLAVPVSLIGTFVFFPLVGFSINTLSIFGLVLAIGLVVDDAIVVVEAVERKIEQGFDPKTASLKAMEEISGPLVGIALVLATVFVPTIFIPGITGRLYQQFAATIAISVMLSAFNALTLSPALAAMLLKPRTTGNRHLLRPFFGWFNHFFDRSTEGYLRWSRVLIDKSAIAFAVLAVAGIGAVLISQHVPSSFLPVEDQGYLFMHLQLPTGASIERTEAAAEKVEQVLAHTPGVKYTTSVLGFSLLNQVATTYTGFFFVTLDAWGDRHSRETQYQEIVQQLNRNLARMPDGLAFGFPPPAILGVGTSGGFTFVLEDRGGKDVSFLAENVQKFIAAASKRPEIAPGLLSTFLPSVPQQFLSVDREKVLKQGVPLNDVYRTVQAYMGGLFVNYFNRFGRQWQVYLEAEGDYRANLDHIGQFYVRNSRGAMVPLSALAHFETRYGPEFTMRYNLYRSAQIIGSAAPGFSSAQAMKALEETFDRTMPREMGYDYLGMSFQEKQSQQGIPSWAIFTASLVFVFLILAALYESWSLPFSVLLSTPMAVFGAFAALWLRRWATGLYLPAYSVAIENDVYSQIGLVMLIGLAAKNSILIVAFAKAEYEKGKPLIEAALGAASLRLRPLLMTSFAFILGCVPLWTASGAGAIARQVMGTAVIGGMLIETLIGRFLIPAIFVVVEKLSGATSSAVGLTPSPAEGD